MRVLGIDFGTTSLKICILDEAKDILYEAQARHDAESELGVQDVAKTLGLAMKMLEAAEKEHENIERITVAGQMHGIVFWYSNLGEDLTTLDCSALYTWQYPETTKAILAELTSLSPIEVFPGYGSSTHLYLQRKNELKSSWDRCGTIMDFFVAWMTRCKTVFIGTQNANDWGCAAGKRWNHKDLVKGITLPSIAQDGEVLAERVIDGFPFKGAEICVPLGDLQAAIFPFIREKTAVLNMGTAAQICCLVAPEYKLPAGYGHLRLDPFDQKSALLVAAGLNGGTALQTFLTMISNWSFSLQDGPCTELDLAKIIENCNKYSDITTMPKFRPTFHGERGLPELSGALISGLTGEESLYEILAALHRGIIETLFTLLPLQFLKEMGIERFCLLGSASEPRFLVHIKHILGGEFQIEKGAQNVSSAYGCAVQAIYQ
ncbi:unnamed protein product, partial [Mesorhabditis spiculigera]